MQPESIEAVSNASANNLTMDFMILLLRDGTAQVSLHGTVARFHSSITNHSEVFRLKLWKAAFPGCPFTQRQTVLGRTHTCCQPSQAQKPGRVKQCAAA
jgi:hypothetical protein